MSKVPFFTAAGFGAYLARYGGSMMRTIQAAPIIAISALLLVAPSFRAVNQGRIRAYYDVIQMSR